MLHPDRRPATYADLLRVADHLVAEIVNGELYTHARPAPKHAAASMSLAGQLNVRFQHGDGGPGGWWILAEPELHLGDDVVVPDIAGWRVERTPTLPQTAWFELPPNWVCEVLSPSTGMHDRVRKLPVYAAAGIGWAWLVDPVVHTIEVYSLRDGSWMLDRTVGGEEDAALPPFEAVPLPLARLWGTPSVRP